MRVAVIQLFCSIDRDDCGLRYFIDIRVVFVDG